MRATLLAAALAALALLAPAVPGAQAQTRGEDGDAIVVINGRTVVERGETVDGVFVVNGDVRIDGRVDGEVLVISGVVTISGRVDETVFAVSDRARVLPGAGVGGDLHYGDERPIVSPRAIVEGDIEKQDFSDVGLAPLIGAFALWVAVTISTLVLGVLLLLLAPRAADATFAQVGRRFWTAVGIGAGVFIALPIAIGVAAVTLVGIPLAIGLGLAVLPLAALAYVTAAWALGRVMVKPPQGRILAFVAGLAILRALALIPVLGLLVGLAAVVVGLGLLAGAILAARGPDAPAPEAA